MNNRYDAHLQNTSRLILSIENIISGEVVYGLYEAFAAKRLSCDDKGKQGQIHAWAT